MKIKAIFIASESEGFIEIQGEERERIAGQGTKLETVSLVQASEFLESSYDKAMASRYLVEEVEKKESTKRVSSVLQLQSGGYGGDMLG